VHSDRAADLVLLSDNIITLQPDFPRAEALAVRDGLIQAVGAKREVLGLASSRTEIVECEGRCVVPGFHDAHLHLLACASKLMSVDCSPSAASSIGEIQEAIRARARSVPPGTWIRAGDYDEFRLQEKRHPTRWELDAASPESPVKLQHRSHHACVLNSAALRLAGISSDTPPSPGRIVDFDPVTHEPTGLLYEYEGYLSERIIPPFNEAELRLSLREVFEGLLADGITSVQDATFSNGLAEWERLDYVCASLRMRPRVGFMVGEPNLGDFIERGMGPGFGNDWLRVGAVKIMLTETAGDFHPPLDVMARQVWRAHQHGYQVAIHAVEESTICVAIGALASAMRDDPMRSHRIEHCSVLPMALADELAGLGIVVVTQPCFLYYSGDRYLAQCEDHIGEWLYPIRSLLDRSVVVGAGSDAPICSARPLEGIYAAVSRCSREGRIVGGGETISPQQALWLYTTGAAQACREYHRKGSIQPGKLADLVVLSADPTAVDANEIKDIQVQMTIVGGQVAWHGK